MELRPLSCSNHCVSMITAKTIKNGSFSTNIAFPPANMGRVEFNPSQHPKMERLPTPPPTSLGFSSGLISKTMHLTWGVRGTSSLRPPTWQEPTKTGGLNSLRLTQCLTTVVWLGTLGDKCGLKKMMNTPWQQIACVV